MPLHTYPRRFIFPTWSCFLLTVTVVKMTRYSFTCHLHIYIITYNVPCSPTNLQCGVIECVPDAKSRDQIGRKINTDLFVYFKKEYGEESSQGRMKETTDRIATLQTWEPYQMSYLIVSHSCSVSVYI